MYPTMIRFFSISTNRHISSCRSTVLTSRQQLLHIPSSSSSSSSCRFVSCKNYNRSSSFAFFSSSSSTRSMARIPSSSSKSKSKSNNENDNNNNHHHQDYQEKELVQPKQQQQLPTKNDRHRRYRLDVAIVGAPNAGKSQLLNVLTKTPISAVSRKRHTTRSDVLGARTIIEDDDDGDDDNNHDKNDDNDIDSNSTNTSASSIKATQIIFKDTPGFLRLENAKSERLDRDLIVTAAAELQTVDYSLLVVDAARKLTPTYTSALTELMKGALNSRGRIEIVHDDDYDDDDFDIETLKNNEKDSMNKNKNKNNQSLQLRPKFAIVLNKVDLVINKNSLIEMAMEIGSIADKLLHEKYGDVGGGGGGGPVVSNKSSSSSDDNEVDVDVDLDIMIMEVAPIVFYVSALKEPEECEIDLIQHLLELATPSKEWILDPQETTTLTPIEQIEEVIREKLYRCLHRELPHSIRQINRMFHKIPSTTSSSSSQKLSSGTGGGSVGGLIIQQDLIVFTKSHKKLVLGKGGRTLQRIQDTATKDLIKIFNCEISLRLNVKLGKSKNIRNSDQYDY